MVRQRWQGERLGLWWWLTIAALYAPAGAIVRLKYRNADRIPRTGPAIIAVNHISHIDPFLMCRLLLDSGRIPHFLAKESIFAVPVVGTAMRGMQHIPVRRGTSDARQSLDKAVAALRAGHIILIDPEGTVTRDPEGWPMTARTGTARLAMLAPEVPVIPVGQWGVQASYDLYRKHVTPWRRVEHTISVGNPVDMSAFRGRDITAETLREATDTIMRAVRRQVADARGLPEPSGPFFQWKRSSTRARV